MRGEVHAPHNSLLSHKADIFPITSFLYKSVQCYKTEAFEGRLCSLMQSLIFLPMSMIFAPEHLPVDLLPVDH